MLGAALGIGDTAVNKTNRSPALKKFLDFAGSAWKKALTLPGTKEGLGEECHLSHSLLFDTGQPKRFFKITNLETVIPLLCLPSGSSLFF